MQATDAERADMLHRQLIHTTWAAAEMARHLGAIYARRAEVFAGDLEDLLRSARPRERSSGTD